MSMYRSKVIMTLMLAIIFVAIQLTNCQAHMFPRFNTKMQGSSAKYCGSHLSDALRLLCNSDYNPMFKKSDQEMQLDDYGTYSYDYPLRSRASAYAMMGRFGGGRFHRESRGVHDECCLKPCSISELTSYCAH